MKFNFSDHVQNVRASLRTQIRSKSIVQPMAKLLATNAPWWALFVVCNLWFNQAIATELVDPSRYSERSMYLQAKQQLRAGQLTSFKRSLSALQNYPLHPYLEYAKLRSQVSLTADKDILAFTEANPALPITPLLRQRWLRSLGSHRRWQRLLKHYDADRNVEIRCYVGRANLATGNKRQGYKIAKELWLHGKSQPKACDALFQQWIEAGQLTADLVWDRLGLALAANQRPLAKYLIRLLPKKQLATARLYYQAQVNPANVLAADLVRKSAKNKQIIVHAHQRLVRRDEMELADQLRNKYAKFSFTSEQRQAMTEAALIGWANQGVFADDPEPLSNLSVATQEKLILAAVRAQEWPLVRHWVGQLETDVKDKNQWQYWAARATLEQEPTTDSPPADEPTPTQDNVDPAATAQLQLIQLAAKRDYYGFLAAQQLGTPASLNRIQSTPDAAAIGSLQARPELARVLELYAVREYIAARREWVSLLRQLTPDEQAAAAHLAAEIGWPRQSIEAANRARLHDDTDLRFPMVHMSAYQRMSHATLVPLTLLLAVSRQESAFDERARSHADARGLMQLLPSTASRIAKKVSLAAPTKTALYRPSTNIEIASHYLAFLLERFGGSRPLALAGYNAGEHRVDRWLAEAANMPMDVWIERIPYGETRNYVKNVLAFSQVYNRKLNLDAPLLRTDELSVPLLPQSRITVVDKSSTPPIGSKG